MGNMYVVFFYWRAVVLVLNPADVEVITHGYLLLVYCALVLHVLNVRVHSFIFTLDSSYDYTSQKKYISYKYFWISIRREVGCEERNSCMAMVNIV